MRGSYLGKGTQPATEVAGGRLWDSILPAAVVGRSWRASVNNRDQAIAVVGRSGARRAGDQFAIQGGDELLNLQLHLAHLLAHVENDLDAREVHAQVAREVQDHFQAFEIVVRVEPRVALAARRLEQAFALVEAERLRMDGVLLGNRGNHVSSARFRSCHTRPLRLSTKSRRAGLRGAIWRSRAAARGCARRADRALPQPLRLSDLRAGRYANSPRPFHSNGSVGRCACPGESS